ncbi:cytochrome c family protein [uncultured Lamprocystis sp.]|jgi:hypothetical protein|uniref:cytochrome c family protein n=1 Tax=uncultured Lamprocystis sp. TaxID=543132 RepID=UPI0025E6B8CF|nr:cytochrome c family protein [uncultured Lamprocystis sp.]
MRIFGTNRDLARTLLLALACIGGPAALSAADQQTPIHQVSAEVCKDCHQEIYRQWQGSMHAKSTALSDPIHGTFYRQEVGDPQAEGQVHQKTKTFPVCLSCHAPNAARDKTTKLDAMPAYSEGVNCVACHTIAGFKGVKGEDGKLRLGLAAYTLSDTLQGPAGFPRGLQKLSAGGDLFGGAVGDGTDQKPNPHLGEPVEFRGQPVPALPLEANAVQFKTSDACMGCHDQRNNPQGVPLCQTGNEYLEGASKVVCQSCHMPVAGGISDHTMGGGHNAGMLKRSVVFTLTTDAADGKVKTKVRLQNLQPHSMPTGAPFRNLYLKLAAYDAAGNLVWQNAEGHPSKGDPKAYFSYNMVDDKGMPAPPPTATKAGDDTRLKPHEVRELSYQIPAKGVVLVRGELYYNLLWPALAEKFTNLPEELRSPVLIGVAESAVAAR